MPTNPCNTYCSKGCKGYNAYYIREYGITQDEFEAMKETQDFKCAICGGEGFIMRSTHHKEKLCIDHDHATGQVRGLLCHNCNRALGLLADNPDIIQKALDYVKKYK